MPTAVTETLGKLAAFPERFGPADSGQAASGSEGRATILADRLSGDVAAPLPQEVRPLTRAEGLISSDFRIETARPGRGPARSTVRKGVPEPDVRTVFPRPHVGAQLQSGGGTIASSVPTSDSPNAAATASPEVEGARARELDRLPRLSERTGTPAGEAARATSAASANPSVTVGANVSLRSGRTDRTVAEPSVDSVSPGPQMEPHGLHRAHAMAPSQNSAQPPQSVPTQVLQVSAAIQAQTERAYDIHLSPAELGKVRISLSPSDAGITVSILADRPETLDLLRRHADLLAQDFRDMGYESATFSFGAESQGENSGDQGQSGSDPSLMPGQPDRVDQEQVITEPVNRRSGSGRMDLRI